MVRAAIDLMEAAGDAGFSIRKLGEQLGCDPMAVLYHFKSRQGLERAMADWLTGQLQGVDDDGPWQDRLQLLAAQYRRLALRFPRSFGLMQRFLSTGVADFSHIERVNRALVDAGVATRDLPSISLGWYATVYGLAMAEIGGLIRAATAEDLAEVERLPTAAFPLTKQLMPAFGDLEPAEVSRLTLELFHRGIAIQAKPPPPRADKRG